MYVYYFLLDSRQAKLFETSIVLTEVCCFPLMYELCCNYCVLFSLLQLALDDSFIRGDMHHMKDMWLIRATNIPHPGDTAVPNPGL